MRIGELKYKIQMHSINLLHEWTKLHEIINKSGNLGKLEEMDMDLCHYYSTIVLNHKGFMNILR